MDLQERKIVAKNHADGIAKRPYCVEYLSAHGETWEPDTFRGSRVSWPTLAEAEFVADGQRENMGRETRVVDWRQYL